jgi:hypothetical protein
MDMERSLRFLKLEQYAKEHKVRIIAIESRFWKGFPEEQVEMK